MLKLLFLVLLIVITFRLIFTKRQMLIPKKVLSTANPVGLFVIASSQLYDDKDINLRNFVIDTSASYLTPLLKEKGLDIRELNPIIPHEMIFKKHVASFYIDEKLLAKYAKEQGCNSALIVYYAYTSIGNFFMPSKKLNVEDSSDFHFYKRCSLYGFFVETSDGTILSKSHLRLINFDKFVSENTKKIEKENCRTIKEIYKLFIINITKRMYSGIIK